MTRPPSVFRELSRHQVSRLGPSPLPLPISFVYPLLFPARVPLRVLRLFLCLLSAERCIASFRANGRGFRRYRTECLESVAPFGPLSVIDLEGCTVAQQILR